MDDACRRRHLLCLQPAARGRPDGSRVETTAGAIDLIREQVARLGRFAVVGNYSFEPKEVSTALHQELKAQQVAGQALHYQTVRAALMVGAVTPVATVEAALAQGACAVEMPVGFESAFTTADAVSANALLAANAVGRQMP